MPGACGTRPDAPRADGPGGPVRLARPDRPGARQRQGRPARARGRAAGTVDVDAVPARLQAIASRGTIRLLGEHEIAFTVGQHLEFNRRKKLGYHPNGMRFTAYDGAGTAIRERAYYSIGGGFVADEAAARAAQAGTAQAPELPYPFTTGEKLSPHQSSGLPVSGIMMENEQALGRTPEQIQAGLFDLWQVMRACVERGCRTDGMLPGGLKVRAARRACSGSSPANRAVMTRCGRWTGDPVCTRGQRGERGRRPGGHRTHQRGGRHHPGRAALLRPVRARRDRVGRGAVPADGGGHRLPVQGERLLSGAEVGCQGEVGSACSMAAGALAEVLGGTPEQVENAAEIGIEHHLGLTCDPIGGLVQVPCIERNAVASVTAIHAARLPCAATGVTSSSSTRPSTRCASPGANAGQVQGDFAWRPRRQRHRVLAHGRV